MGTFSQDGQVQVAGDPAKDGQAELDLTQPEAPEENAETEVK